jgi:hypothetical protein
VTEAEKIAARARIFMSLGLGPDGMCKTTNAPTLRNIEDRMDDASRTVLSEHELAICAREGVSPSTFLIARGVSTEIMREQPPSRGHGASPYGGPIPRDERALDEGRHETSDAPLIQGRLDIQDNSMVEMVRESLAKFEAGVGGRRNRDHLFAAARLRLNEC